MRKQEIDKDIWRYFFPANPLSKQAEVQAILKPAFKKINLGTYGGMNTDVFYETLLKRGYPVQREEICPEDDDSIGLRMPNFWPVNQSEWALSTAMYYSFYQIKHLSILDDLSSWNPEARQDFGWVSAVEVYDTTKLVGRLRSEKMDFFTTSLTLMECVRYLEGWGIKRLEAYRDYSNEIKAWAQKQAFFDASEWNLGREKSEAFFKEHGRISNVRLCVKEYWKMVLLNKGYNPGDKEIDIVSRAFSKNRNPDIVLIGEGFLDLGKGFVEFDLSKEDVDIEALKRDESKMVFPYNRYKGRVRVYSRREQDNGDHALATAKLAREHHPNAKIILLSYELEERKLFRLVKSDEVKEGMNLEVALAGQAILDAKNEKDYVRQIGECLK